MCWEFLDRLGPQSAKPKHLKGKKNKRFPWVWGLRPQTQGNLLIFFAFQMLSLALPDRLQSIRVWFVGRASYLT